MGGANLKAYYRVDFRKAERLRRMRCVREISGGGRPLVTGFAYDCANTNLTFFDFVKASQHAGEYSPTLLCVLGKCLFGFIERESNDNVAVNEPHSAAIPVMYTTGEDSLLVYMHFLSRWAGMSTESSRQLTRYGRPLFSTLNTFLFHNDFLEILNNDQAGSAVARRCFQGRAGEEMESVYVEARGRLGLEVTNPTDEDS